MKQQRGSVLISLVLSFLFVACNKTTSTPSETGDKSPENKVSSLVYPHGAEFFKTHGQTYRENKPECLKCHGEQGSVPAAKNSCTQCHSSFPHPQNWAMPQQHAAEYMKNSQSCATCHGSDWKGGKTQVSCATCHNGFPHPVGWAVPSIHGKAYVALEDKKQCLGCHDPAKKDAKATRCDTCHKAFPYLHADEQWMGDKTSKHAQLGRTYEGKCLICHRDYKENMPTFGESGGCLTCHGGNSLEIHWKPDAAAPAATTSKNLKTESRKPSSPHKPKKVN